MKFIVPLAVLERAGFDRDKWPVTTGIPFPKGALRSTKNLHLINSKGVKIPYQTRTLGFWDDGSIKWLLLDFQATLEAGKKGQYYLEMRDDETTPLEGYRITIEEDNHALFVDTGVLKAEFLKDRFTLFNRVWIRKTCNGEWNEVLIRPGDIIITDVKGKAYRSSRDLDFLYEIEERGPLRAVLKFTGCHRGDDERAKLFDFTVRLHFYAGKRFVKMFYTFINRQNQDYENPKRISICMPVPSNAGNLKIGIDGCKSLSLTLQKNETVKLYQKGPTADCAASFHTPFKFNIKSREREIHSGEKASGWIDISGDDVGLMVTVRKFWEQHPKGLTARKRELRIDIWPSDAGVLDFPKGAAKTHEILYYFHSSITDRNIQRIASSLMNPLFATPTPKWLCESGAFGELSPADPENYPRYENMVRTGFEGLKRLREENKEYGMMNFGDWTFSGSYWGNEEYDLPHALFLMYARTGKLEFLEWAEDAVRHFMDIDTIHHTFDYRSPYGPRYSFVTGGIHIHSDKHIRGGIGLGHIWVEGVLDYFHLFGDQYAKEVAESIGHFCELSCEATNFIGRQEREAGWMIIALTAMYRATGLKRYLDAAEKAVSALLKWQDPYRGLWSHKLDPNECRHRPQCEGGKPFMVGIVLEGLKNYHKITGDEKVKQCILKAVEWLLREAWIPKDGGFYYSSCLTFKNRGLAFLNYLIIEGIGYAYELSGKRKYLELGLQALNAALPSIEKGFTGEKGRPVNGKAYAQATRSSPRFIYLLQKLGITERDLSAQIS